MKMDVETRIGIIKRKPTSEVVTDEDLRNLLETKQRPVHYIGMEISGLLHIGSVFMLGYKLRDFLEAGCIYSKANLLRSSVSILLCCCAW